MLSFCIFMFRPSSHPASTHNHTITHIVREPQFHFDDTCVYFRYEYRHCLQPCAVFLQKKQRRKKNLKNTHIFSFIFCSFCFCPFLSEFFVLFFFLLLSLALNSLHCCCLCHSTWNLHLLLLSLLPLVSIQFDSIPDCSVFFCCIHRRYSLLHKSGSLLFLFL